MGRRPRCAVPMAFVLQLLPELSGSAAENMALDFLLLQRFPEPSAARFF